VEDAKPACRLVATDDPLCRRVGGACLHLQTSAHGMVHVHAYASKSRCLLHAGHCVLESVIERGRRLDQ
jgi:hypothetical protein